MCWQSYGRRSEREPVRTSEPANIDDLRIADSDRERAIAQLSKHARDGRLTLEEFEERVAEVYTARTNADLRPVFRGLPSYDHVPPARRGRSRTRPRFDVEEIVRPLVMLALLVWAAVAFGAWVLWIGFWVLLPRLVWGRHRRLHRAEYELPPAGTRDDELTIV